MAQEGGVLFAGSICQTAGLYSRGAGKKVVMKTFREQTAITMCIGPAGDSSNVPAGECAVRLARAGTMKLC